MFIFLVDGKFSSWSNFGVCSKSCGPGTQSRTRSCTNPPPQFGGKDCVGDILQTRNCSFGQCPGKSLHVFFKTASHSQYGGRIKCQFLKDARHCLQ